MYELSHRVRVFVYRFEGGLPHYLLMRRSQSIESFWTPLHGRIGFGEKLESAIRREVMDETGLGRPLELIDLKMPQRWLVGDEEVIEWHFGFRTVPSAEPRERGTHGADFRWEPFPMAYPSLELEADRAAIMRLHAILHVA
jgi:ADP-ribose pyrophosphatase YjhB (NUDIX family)